MRFPFKHTVKKRVHCWCADKSVLQYAAFKDRLGQHNFNKVNSKVVLR